MKKQRLFAGNGDMANNHCGSVLACLILIGGCIYMNHSFTPHPLHEDLVKLIIKIAIFMFAILGLVKLFYALRSMQFAIMDEKGIKFKNGFGSLGFVSWSDIESAKKDSVLVYKIVGRGKRRHIKKCQADFYVIVSTDYHVYPSINLNPKHGGIARTIPAPDSRFEEQLYFYRPDLKPEITEEEH